MRDAIGAELLEGMEPTVTLGSVAFLPSAYEAGSIAAKQYQLAALPTAAELGQDLQQFVTLYSRSVEVKDVLATNRRVRTSARSEKKRQPPVPSPIFKPKDSSEYLANVAAATQTRRRTHESLIDAFGSLVIATGRQAATNVHPRDLTIRDGEEHWLVEAKTVGANAELGVRDAIGQLFSYRHFYYRARGQSDPRLLALFSAPIGNAFEELLMSLGMEYVHREDGEWRGSEPALQLTRPV